MNYSEKLKDPRWQKKRLEILEDRGWACEICCSKEISLNVHHSSYDKDKNPWEYENYRLRVLCSNCHSEEHNIGRAVFTGLAERFITEDGYTFIEIALFISSNLPRFGGKQ